MRYCQLLPLLVCLGSSALAQPVEIDPSDFGKILIAPRQSTNALVYEQAIGDYQNEPVVNYGADGPAVQLGRPIGRLSMIRDDGTSGLCTAFIVDADHILTNHHCIPGMDGDPTGAISGVTAAQFVAGYIHPGRVRDVDNYTVSPRIVETNRQLDYSILRVFGDPSKKYGIMELVAEDPGDSEFLWIIGHPMGQSQHISREGCAAASPAIEEGKLVHTCDTLVGNSGSPVIRLTDRRVVALHHAGDNLTGFNFAIPMREILAQSKVLKAAFALSPDAEAPVAPDPVLSVNADGSGDHRDLASAIAAADPGMRIEIRPGTYAGGVLIDKPLEIIGVGEREEIILSASDTATIHWTATDGHLANLTILQAGEVHPAVLFADGTGTLIDNDLSSQSRAVIAIESQAIASILSNFIHDSAGIGIVSHGGPGTEISTNVIERNARSGLLVEAGSDPLIKNNKIRFNGHYGIIFTGAAKGLTEGNDISRNDWGGVEITKGANAVLKGNKIGYNQGPAVRINVEGHALIEGNTILNNFAVGLIVESIHSPVVINNRISGNLQGAVWVPENGTGIFENNKLEGNSGGFIIDDNAGKVVRKDTAE